jgi:RPA family protein
MLMDDLEKKAECLNRCHNYLAKVYIIINEVISISVILVSGVITAFLPMIDANTDVLNSSLAFYIGVVTSISKSYKPAERYQRHRVASQGYISLTSKIKYENNDTEEFKLDIISRFEILRKDSPFVSNKLYDKTLARMITN